MFGQNPIRKQVLDDGSKLRVQELFYTIQGEGPFSGSPAVFLRLAGCNLACSFCDTDFESGYDNLVPTEEVVRRVFDLLKEFQPIQPLVVLTGGEPLRQNIVPLLDALMLPHSNRINLRVQIETAGTVFPEGLSRERYQYLGQHHLTIVCSPKTKKVNPRLAEECWDWKYIIDAQDPDYFGDGLPSVTTQSDDQAPYKVYRPEMLGSFSGETIWVQPCDEKDDVRNQKNLDRAKDISMKHGYRITLQTHKLLNVP